MSDTPASHNKPSLTQLLLRGLLLKCPTCGKGKLFAGWFIMSKECSECGRQHERAPGFFLGSIYFNYGVTAVIVTGMYGILRFALKMPPTTCLISTGLVCFIFPTWFFRYARALWVSFDELWDPWKSED